MKKAVALALIILMSLNLTAFGKSGSAGVSKSDGDYLSFSNPSGGTNTTAAAPVLSVDQPFFALGIEGEAVFTLEGAPDTKTVTLYYGADHPAGQMTDQGVDGDKTAGDGVFSLCLTIGKDVPFSSRESFYAKADGIKSNLVTLYSFKLKKTEKEAQKQRKDFERIQTGINQIEAKYYGDEGFVPKEKYPQLTADILAYLEGHMGKEILLYEAENEAVYIKYMSGIASVFEPYVPDTNGSGGDDISLKFWIYQPTSDIVDYPHYGGRPIAEEVRTLTESLENCTFENEYTASQVTLDAVRKLPSNAVIFWNGHGGYGPFVKSYLFTGESFDWEKYIWDASYEYECFTDQIICRDTKKQKNLMGVTANFFKQNPIDLSNDLIFLLSCHSLQHERLADALIGNGAETVVGFTDEVMVSYAINIGLHTLKKMAEKKKDSGQYYTVSEAVEMAKQEFGSNDFVWFAKEFPEQENIARKAEPKIAGNKNYRLAAALDDSYKAVQGLWCTFSSLSNLYYFEGDKVTFLENANPGNSADYRSNTYIKHEAKSYSVEKKKPEEGSGYKILIEDGPEFWTNEEYKDTLDLCWYDENGVLQYSGSGSIWRITDCSINDLKITDVK